MPATFTLTVDQIQFSDVVVLAETRPVSQASVVTPTSGSLEAWLSVPDPGGSPAGRYSFAVGPDLSASPP
jgi:hypothetical protein